MESISITMTSEMKQKLTNYIGSAPVYEKNCPSYLKKSVIVIKNVFLNTSDQTWLNLDTAKEILKKENFILNSEINEKIKEAYFENLIFLEKYGDLNSHCIKSIFAAIDMLYSFQLP
jgi:hypothetical protein